MCREGKMQLKILFWGLGSIGSRHANIIRKLYPSFELLSYRTKKSKLVKNVPNEMKYFYDINKAFSANPDVVFITNPTCKHIHSAILGVEKGCNMFIEKPLSNSLDGIEELIDKVNEKKLITLMGCNLRFHPVIRRIKDIVDGFEYGRVFYFRANCSSYLPDWRPWQDYRKSYSAIKALGGGVLLDLIHEIDYTQWIFGNFQEIKGFTEKISDLEIETKDFAEMQLRTDKNIFGSIQLDYFRVIPERVVTVVFKDHVIKGDLINNKLMIYSKEGQIEEKYNIDINYTYEKQIEYFINSIINKKKTFNGIEEGYKVLKYAFKVK